MVRLKGGDPFVFGRGSEEVEALAAAGIDYEVVPGVSSAFAVPASAGVPVTHRGLSSSVTVVTGHVGDPSAPGAVAWEALARVGGTVVILMGMENRAEIARLLIVGGRAPQTPVLVVEWGTSPAQRTARVRLDQLATVGLGPPATIVVGAVAGLDLGGRGRGPLSGRSVVVTRPRERSDDLVSGLAAAGGRGRRPPRHRHRAIPRTPGHSRRRPGAPGSTTGSSSARSTPSTGSCRSLRDGRALGGARLAAVGPATAAALADRHLVADLVPAEATAEALVAAMPDAPSDGGRSMTTRGNTRAGASGAGSSSPGGRRPRRLAPGLRAKGWEVDEVEAYRTVTAVASDGATTDARRGGGDGGRDHLRLAVDGDRLSGPLRRSGPGHGGVHRPGDGDGGRAGGAGRGSSSPPTTRAAGLIAALLDRFGSATGATVTP